MRKSILLIGLALLSLPFLVIALFLVALLPGTPELGNAIARKMIERASTANGVVNLAEFGDKVCLVPEGIGVRGYTDDFFPDFKVALRESDESEGVWYILVGSNSDQSVRIYAVEQRVLSWKIPEEQDYRKFVGCPEHIAITIKDEPDSCSNLETAGAKPRCRIFLTF